ncbi:MAG: filamentous hemagglutinin family protein, partial [Verrucomicrobiota bacterium]
GKTGGSISLAAHNNLTLAAGSNLSVAAQQFDSAGKGGSILLEAGTQLNGTANTSALLDLQQGSQIDLSVATYVAGEYTKFGSSAFEGKFTGTLHLRAPRNADNSDVLINPIHSEITGASAVVVEGYKVYDLTDYGGMMNIAAKSWVQLDGQAFLGAAGSLSANDKVITDRLLANQSAEQKEKLSSVLVLAPGVEMINSATAANTQLYLNSAGSTITIAAGGSVLFPNGSFGNSVISSAAATIVSATGEATSIDAKTPTVIPLGSKLLFGNSGATVTYATVIGSPGGAIEASLVTGSSYTTGSTAATNSSANIAERGTIVSLNSASGTFEKASSIALNTGSAITFPNGTGSSKIRSNVTGKIASRVGVVTDLIANTDITIPSGSYITLNEAGSISYSSGTGGVSIALASGSLKTNLAVTITPPTGDLTLGLANNSATGSTNPEALASADWDFSAFRYGMKSAPGVLTLRTSGNLVFNNTLSDGFTPVTPGASNGDSSMWLAPLMTLPKNAPLGSYPLPTNAQSWSYRLTAGADMNASNFRSVLSASDLGSSKGSVLVGEFYPAVPNTLSDSERAAVGPEGKTANSIRISKTDANKGNRFEVIRTGTGDITLSAGRDVQLRNQFSTIYTAGVALPTPTTIYGANDFVLPVNLGLDIIYTADGTLGAAQQLYAPSWSLAGGNVVISAQANIGRYTRFYDNTGSPTDVIIADSSREMPTNWLYRRGFVDPKTQLFANDGGFADDRGIVTDNATSTAWWIDFSNFFQGVGALGGGNVSLTAGNDVVNADAVSPTNARMPGLRDGVNVAPDASKLLELGGGDVSVVAGRNIDGGVYYVEKGKGTLFAGGEITTNASRSPSLGILNAGDSAPLDPLTWLPTTLFVGKSTFDVAARGDVLLGPITNPFLLPQGINNNFWYKTYFNTYSPDAGATVASYGGDITHRMAVSLPGDSSSTSIMSAWFSSQGLFNGDESTASSNQPWLRLSELKLFASYSSIFGLTAPNLESTSFGGDLNLVGSWTLFPSATGNLQLAANSNIVGLQKSGVGNRGLQVWTASTINLSDASPAALPGVITPLAYQSQSEVGRTLDQAYHSGIDILQVTRDSLSETGSSTGSAATSAVKQALHAPGILHSDDSNPVRLFATGGDITGLTLFSPKATQIMAQRDITDIAFYLQNISASDITLVSAGRDIIPFAENSTIRSLANNVTMGNAVGDLLRSTASGDSTSAMAGDIQINGPGVMEVLSGRNIDLGTGANFTDGTGVGITSIGNLRNPNLPFGGADLIALAGVSGAGGQADGLSLSSMNVDAFISQYLSAGTDRTQSAYLEKIDWNGEFSELTAEQKAIVALEKFYQILRDTGRNVPKAGNYDAGYEAVATLFGKDQPIGDILTRAREIRTTTGGAISLASVGGGITMASAIFGNPLTPPGIVTEYGGAISTFTEKDVSIGQARIFTLRGGDITMWSSNGNIAAGTSPKTVVTAPPTRVLINVNSADVQTDLGGLATGGGIGVLAAVEGVKAGNVDLIAPKGYVDAGDAGIRVTGNLNIAANVVLNSSNISTGGTSTGTNPGAVSAPSVASVSSASSSGAAAGAAMTKPDSGKPAESKPAEEPLSLYTVEVIGYGGGDAEDTESEEKQKSL